MAPSLIHDDFLLGSERANGVAEKYIAVGTMVEEVCFTNARDHFGFALPAEKASRP
ncbi:MAG TPA: hypothetical protein VGC39_10580 [Candidatus Methylacidiphilales bacterium]